MLRQWTGLGPVPCYDAANYLCNTHGLLVFQPRFDFEGDLFELPLPEWRQAVREGETVSPRSGDTLLLSDVVLGFRPTDRLAALEGRP